MELLEESIKGLKYSIVSVEDFMDLIKESIEWLKEFIESLEESME
jgi:hypothetical protein